MRNEKNRGRTSQGQNGERMAKRAPASQFARPVHEAPQPKPQRGRCGAERERSCTAKLYINTYNVRTMSHPDDLDRLLEQLQKTKFKWDIIGLCETKRKGEGLTELKNGDWIFDAGKTEEDMETKGLAFLIKRSMKDYIESLEKHSDRVISCKIKLQGESMQLIQVYAPTTDYDDQAVEKFYADIEQAIDKKTCKNTIILGDFNAKIGIKKHGEKSKWIGPHGIGERNDRGERLLDFVTENKLYITNSFFKKHPSRYWTWEAHEGKYKNQIDFILTSDNSIIKNTEIISNIDVGSAHRMVRGKIFINKKLM